MPLPTDLELESPSKKEWSLIPADVYQAEITDITYKEIDNRYKKEATDPDKKQVMEFEFTIIEEGEFYGRKMWKQMAPMKPYPSQNNKPSWVYRLATAMEGHPITKDEADKFASSNINDYLHRQVRITISLSDVKDNGKQYNNLDSFLSVKTNLPIFDLNKVPKENAAPSETSPEAKNEPSGYDNAKAVSDSLSGSKPVSHEQIAPDIQEIADQMENEVNVEDIPF